MIVYRDSLRKPLQNFAPDRPAEPMATGFTYFSCAIRRYRNDDGSVGNLQPTTAVKHLARIGCCTIPCCRNKNRNFRCAVRRLGVWSESTLKQSASARAAHKNECNAHQCGKSVPSNQLIPLTSAVDKNLIVSDD